MFLVDAISGLTPADEDVAGILRRANKPVILVVNKADNGALRLAASTSTRWGWATHTRFRRCTGPELVTCWTP